LRWKLGIDPEGQRLTQMASSSTNTSTQILDGSALIDAAPQACAVDSNVTANYDGQTVTIGQIAVATEANTAGLIASGNNNVSGFKMMLSNIAERLSISHQRSFRKLDRSAKGL
jgi:flagellar hook protein FlgE